MTNKQGDDIGMYRKWGEWGLESYITKADDVPDTRDDLANVCLALWQ